MLNEPTKGILKFFSLGGQTSPINSPGSFSAFYERTHLSLFRYLYGLTGGPQEDVEDLTAEAFTRAWKARRTFQGDQGAALGWLFQIGKRLVIDRYRRDKARPTIAGEIPEELPQNGPIPEEMAQAQEEQQKLFSVLQKLPEEQREMMVLRFLLGWQVNEIAAYLGISENTISVTLKRTIQRLHKQWQAQEKLI
jgi:RNA polymerase sigma-70 factor, ECF subfamily